MAVFQAALEAETQRAAAKLAEAAAARRQLAEVAGHEVAVAMRAARMLRADPLAASLLISDLLWRADEDIRSFNREVSEHRSARQPKR